MRVGLWRELGCTAVLACGVAVAAPAEPMPVPAPPAPKLTPAAERAELQAKLGELLERLKTVPPKTDTGAVTAPGPKPKVEPSGPSKGGIDPIKEGMNWFRTGEFESARQLFGLMPTDGMSKADRAFVRYMYASSLRRTGRTTDAENVYREVANSGDDEFLASYATQQIYLISSERELQSQLEQLRARAKSK